MKKQSLPTSKQVAERAKVSQPTVSRVFSGMEGISEATKMRVIRAAGNWLSPERDCQKFDLKSLQFNRHGGTWGSEPLLQCGDQ